MFLLNPQQQQAVDQLEGALLILAGAGTGKTRVIVQRIGNMFQHGIAPEKIVAVTFTNKAAREMQERVALLDGARRDALPAISTFHSFCSTVLRSYADRIGFSRNFTLATEGYQKGLLREIATELQLDGKGIDPYTWLSRISLAKANMQTPDEMAGMDFPDAPRVATIYRRYQERLRRMNMMDYDDLLCNTRELWLAHPSLLQIYQEHFQYIMIDEYQDTNKIQLALMVQLAGSRGNVCAVGDDDQSIYGWRGASQENILEFERFFPKAKVIRLEQNYRSTNTILKAANSLIAHNSARREKNLWSNQGDGELITGVRCADERDEADFIADSIFSLSLEGRALTDRNRQWSNYAVLFRTGGQSRLLEEAMRKRRIPFVLVGSKSFYQRKEILDIITLLELAINPKNDMALQRVINVPPRGVGDATLDKLAELRTSAHRSLFTLLTHSAFTEKLSPEVKGNLDAFRAAILRCGEGADRPGPVFPRVKSLLDELQYIERLIQMYKPRTDAMARRDNVMEFLNSVGDYDREKQSKGTLEDFVQQLALQDANDRREKDKDVTENAVSLMTIHASKGLEFPTVYVCGLEQGLFPHQMAMDEGSLEEERRLCYVAITRAKQKLFLTYADKRHVMNTVMVKRISMFINEIPDELIEYKTPADFKNSATAMEQSRSFMDELLKKFGGKA